MSFIGCQTCQHLEAPPETGYPMFIEPKLDGFRLLAHVDSVGGVVFYSRAGASEPFTKNLRHVGEELRALGFRSCIVDGEITSSSWNQLAKLVRLKTPTVAQEYEIRAQLTFVAFDYVAMDEVESMKWGRVQRVVDRTRQIHRGTALRHMIPGCGCKYVRLGEQRVVTSRGDAEAVFAEMVSAGHEGAVMKDPDAPYVFDRTKSWIALKPTKTVDARIVGYVEGEGKHVGRLGALKVVSEEGVEFSVGTGFDDREREDIWNRRDELVRDGVQIEVRMQAGDVAVARHPAFMRFRLDKAT